MMPVELAIRQNERSRIASWIRKAIELEEKHNSLIRGGCDNRELRAQLNVAKGIAKSIENAEHEVSV
jgi:hypothetical protein